MKCLATMKIKIPKVKKLCIMFETYKQACQYACDKARENKVKHKFELHNLIYYEIRKKFNLKSQFAINAIAKGFEAYKSAKKLKGRKSIFKQVPIRYDRRNFTFFSNKVSLATQDKRCIVPIEIPQYYWKYLDWRYQTADLQIIKNKMFINITFSREVNTRKFCSKALGVDLGVNNLAVTSDGQVFKGHKTRIMQYQHLRKRLQRKGTKSAKRKLKAISGRQKRYMRWVNHNVSKQIVNSGEHFVFEDLTNIRKARNKHMGKRLNRWLNSWSYFQLREFVRYKAERDGKVFQLVDPYMTSQTCSNCGTTGSRYFDSFHCDRCDFSCQSDFNAACNLRRLNVTQPNVSSDDVKGQLTTATELRDKSPAL